MLLYKCFKETGSLFKAIVLSIVKVIAVIFASFLFELLAISSIFQSFFYLISFIKKYWYIALLIFIFLSYGVLLGTYPIRF